MIDIAATAALTEGGRPLIRPLVLVIATTGGSRDPELPALTRLGGATLLDRLLGTLAEAGLAEPILAVAEASAAALRSAVGDRLPVVSAPGSRRAVLAAAAAATDSPWLLVHDAERALTPLRVIQEVLAEHAEILRSTDGRAGAERVDAVLPAIDVTDSVKQILPGGLRNVDRSTLAGLQCPRLIRRELLLAGAPSSVREAAPDPAGSGTAAPAEADDEILAALAAGARVRTVQGSHSGFAVVDRLSLWQAQIALGLARDTSQRQGLSRRS
ncbi:2-C-methyl-D-erythritol 4-phosphate cytidylyltransferase [Brachybacterium sp. DNPG3]